MSEQQAPDRTIRGFGTARNGGGVHPDASRLLARNRVSPPPSPQPVRSDAAEVTDIDMERATVVPPRAQVRRQAPQAAPRPAVKAQINVMVASDLRARVRSAYRATSAAEGHRSFSDFVASLLEAEAARLEQQYNAGQRFGGGEQPLTPGRPLDA
ncbi:hypothetical protein [Jannaschia sp. R86511]|uniref:ParB family protein n=1 Tax=Jannaschia sp. R86511 TaxID=3093853 RepID=UPI0036D37B82